MPIVVTASDVTNVASEFSSENPTRIEAFIEQARLFVCETAWGDRAKTAIIYYTAHLLKLEKIEASGAAGPVTAERVGDLSRSYGQSAGGEASELAQTGYGRIILQLRKGLLITPMVV